MRIQKFLSFLALLFFITIACIVPFPIKAYRKDNLPTYKIEQIDKKRDEDDDDYQAFS